MKGFLNRERINSLLCQCINRSVLKREHEARGGDAHHSCTHYVSFGAVYSIRRAKTGKCWKESTTIVTPCLVEFYNLSSYSKES